MQKVRYKYIFLVFLLSVFIFAFGIFLLRQNEKYISEPDSASTFTMNANTNGATVTNANGWTFVSTGRYTKNIPLYSTLGALPAVTKSGYTFKGWRLGLTTMYLSSSTQTSSITTRAGTVVEINTDFSPNTYRVTYYDNISNSNPSTESVQFNSSFTTKPNTEFTRSAYTLTSWNTKSDGSGDIYSCSTNYNLTTVGGLTLYAQWTPNPCNVKADPNGGSFSSYGDWTNGVKTIAYNSSYGSFPSVTRTGYTLNGWYTAAVGGTRLYTTSVMNKTSDFTIYAQWNGIPYMVVYHPNYSGASSSSESGFVYGTSHSLKKNGFIRAGYTFQGWDNSDKKANGTLKKENEFSVVYSDCASVSTLSSNGSDAHLYAVWKANNYTVKFNANGGLGNLPSQTFTYDSEQALISNSNRIYKTGYSFKGWSLSNTATTADYSDGYKLGTLNSDGTRENLAESGTVTLYAIWEANTYKITYYNNNGNGSMASQDVVYNGSAVAISANAFTREGYIFKCWGDSASGGTTYRPGQSISNILANLNLYAQWEETWTAHASSSLSGNGTDALPYLLSSAEDLAYVAREVNKGNTNILTKEFKQTKNINLKKDKAGNVVNYLWQPIGLSSTKSFKGVYDGNGYLIENLNTVNATNTSSYQIYSYVGLFGYTLGAKLKNINIINGNIYGYNYVGSLVGYANTGEIINCRSGASVDGYAYCGLIGYDIGLTITSCYNYGNVSGYNYVGGIAGRNFSSKSIISNCFVKGTVDASGASSYCGGILGYSSVSSAEIKACGVIGKVKGGSNSGLLAGVMSSGKITDCFVNSSSTSLPFYKSGASVSNSIYSIEGGAKKYIGSEFSSWSVTAKNQPLPAGFSWIGRGGEKLTIKKLTDLGYSA